MSKPRLAPNSRDFWTPERRAKQAETSRRVARRRRVESTAIASEIDLCRDKGIVTEWLRPHASSAREETLALVQAQGGIDRMSEQRLSATQDHGRLGLVLRGLVQMFVEKPEAELATRISTVIGQRRALLALLGLERLEAELVPSLSAYLAQQNSAQRANGADPSPSAEPAEIVLPAEGDGGANT